MYRKNTSLTGRGGLSATTRGRKSLNDTGPQSVLGITYGYEPKNPYLQEIKAYSRNAPTRRSLLQSRKSINFNATFDSEFSDKYVGGFAPARPNAAIMQNGQRRRTLANELELQLTNGGPDIYGESHQNGEIESEITAYDVEVQVRPKMRERGTQSEKEASPATESPKVLPDNEELMEENFRMRRLVDDLRFRLAETAHEKDVLQDELTDLHVQEMQRPKAVPMERPEGRHQDCQTDPVLPVHPFHTSLPVMRDVSPRSATEEDALSPLPLSSAATARLERASRTISYRNLRDIPDDEEAVKPKPRLLADRQKTLKILHNRAEPRRKDSGDVSVVQSVMHGHLTRAQFLDELDEERMTRAQELVQTLFQSHITRVKFLKRQA